jgi:hypothetical protein
MNKIIFSIIFSTFLISLAANDIFACDCISLDDISIEKQVRDAYKGSSAVFVGEVTEIISKPNVYSVLVKFKIEKSWNKNFQKEITISTGRGGGDCGYGFAVGKKFLVYAYGKINNLSTNICTRTNSVASNKDIAILNKIKKSKIKSFPK